MKQRGLVCCPKERKWTDKGGKDVGLTLKCQSVNMPISSCQSSFSFIFNFFYIHNH